MARDHGVAALVSLRAVGLAVVVPLQVEAQAFHLAVHVPPETDRLADMLVEVLAQLAVEVPGGQFKRGGQAVNQYVLLGAQTLQYFSGQWFFYFRMTRDRFNHPVSWIYP